jgi:MraZ protein
VCHRLKVDPKGRLKIPTNLISAVLGAGNEFYVTSNDGNCVRIYPKKVWQKVEGQLDLLCLRSTNYQRLFARAKYFGQSVKIDRQGRLLIPTLLRKRAQMKGGVDVLPYTNHLEVWNHYRLIRHLRSAPALPAVTLDGLLSHRRSALTLVRQHQEIRLHGKDRRFAVHRSPARNSNSSSGHAVRDARTDRSDRVHVA